MAQLQACPLYRLLENGPLKNNLERRTLSEEASYTQQALRPECTDASKWMSSALDSIGVPSYTPKEAGFPFLHSCYQSSQENWRFVFYYLTEHSKGQATAPAQRSFHSVVPPNFRGVGQHIGVNTIYPCAPFCVLQVDHLDLAKTLRNSKETDRKRTL